MTSVISTPPASPTVTPVCEGAIHEVIVGLFFSWNDLQSSLRLYIAKIEDDWEKVEMPEPIKNLCSELGKWLDDPNSAKLEPEKSLQDWKEKVDQIISEELVDLPEIVINKD